MRCIDALELKCSIVASSVIEDGKHIFDIIDEQPTIEPEPKWKRLMMHLADLQLTYSPNWGANGCGDQKLYEFVTGLIDELQGWKEGE